MGPGVLEKIWDFFTPPDPPISDFIGEEASMAKAEGHLKKAVNWGQRLSWSFSAVVFFLILATFTPWGYIRADQLKDKVEAAVKSSDLSKAVEGIRSEQQHSKTEQTAMKVELSEVKAKLETMTPVLNEIYKASTAATICRLLAGKLRAEADAEQTKYRAVAGEFYPESRCGGK